MYPRICMLHAPRDMHVPQDMHAPQDMYALPGICMHPRICMRPRTVAYPRCRSSRRVHGGGVTYDIQYGRTTKASWRHILDTRTQDQPKDGWIYIQDVRQPISLLARMTRKMQTLPVLRESPSRPEELHCSKNVANAASQRYTSPKRPTIGSSPALDIANLTLLFCHFITIDKRSDFLYRGSKAGSANHTCTTSDSCIRGADMTSTSITSMSPTYPGPRYMPPRGLAMHKERNFPTQISR